MQPVEKDAIQAQRILMHMFHHFNKELFGSCPLPTDNLILTIEMKGENIAGCFDVGNVTSVEEKNEFLKKVHNWQAAAQLHAQAQQKAGTNKRFKNVQLEKEINSLRIPRIVMNGMHLSQEMREVAQTLVHEMCHYWQYKWGSRFPKSGTHNKEWADKMRAVGLNPICLDEKPKGPPGTGRKVGDEMIPNGKFEKAFDKLPAELKMPWVGFKFSKKKTSVKKTYQCSCEKTFYTSKEINGIRCTDCNTDFVRVLSEEEQEETEAKKEELEAQREEDKAKAEAEAEERESRRIDGWDDGERRNPELDDLFGDDEHEIVRMKPQQPDRWNADLDNIFG
jgi:predicted SprT family Zn-dependent metalloprotease